MCAVGVATVGAYYLSGFLGTSNSRLVSVDDQGAPALPAHDWTASSNPVEESEFGIGAPMPSFSALPSPDQFPRARTLVDVVSVAGPLATSTVRRTLSQATDPYTGCYRMGLPRAPELQGTITLRLSIAADGTVANVVTTNSHMPDAQVALCLMRMTYGISFEPTRRLTTAAFSVTFVQR